MHGIDTLNSKINALNKIVSTKHMIESVCVLSENYHHI